MFQEDEAGGGANDGGEAPDGGGVRDAQRQALADHLVVVGFVRPVEFLVPGAGRQDRWLFLPKENQGISPTQLGLSGTQSMKNRATVVQWERL